jgi:CheY-like chemotaxis protein
MPSVLIVDDEPDVRFLVRRVLEEADAWCVAGEAASGIDALERCRELHPDIIVLDHRMPGMTGLETAELILAENPTQLIVLFTAVQDPAVHEQATEIGIRACLAKAELDHLVANLGRQIGGGPQP